MLLIPWDPSDVSRLGFGTALAIAISWGKNASILWAIFHGVLSRIYVIYHAFTR